MPTADLDLLRPNLKAVTLKVRFVQETANKPIPFVYFPESGFASVVAHTKGERAIEAGLIGREGMTGLSIVMGDDRSANETFIQATQRASRISAASFCEALESSSTLRKCLLRYVQAFLCQTTQTVLTNGRAKLEERLARWVLMAHDRLDGDDLKLTHEFLALMLGVRRPGVTVALHSLESRGLIQSRRGVVRVIDRIGLEEAADGSYGVPEKEYERLLGAEGEAAGR